MSASTGNSPADIVYDAAWGALAAVSRPALGVAKLRGFRNGWLAGKLGFYAAGDGGPRCWIHACSIGEVGVALRCIAALRAACPDLCFVLTTVTPEGYAFACRHIAPPDRVEWFPFDARSAIRRAYDVFRPEFVILVEVELWPNHLREAAARGIPVFVVNGRLSGGDEQNYRRAGTFMRNIFALPELICARSEEDAARFRRLGANDVVVTGDMKFDPLPGDVAPSQLELAPDIPVLLGASTHPGEDEVLMAIFDTCRAAIPDLLLVLAPRHPTRAGAIRAAATHRGLRLDSGPATRPDCLVVDTVGQLPGLYARATISFVGKSLNAHGGQNFLEAVEAGCPVIFGPHMENFAGAAHAFVAAGAVRQVQNAEELALEAKSLLLDSKRRAEMAVRASAVLESERGATARTMNLLLAKLHHTAAAFTGPGRHGKKLAE